MKISKVTCDEVPWLNVQCECCGRHLRLRCWIIEKGHNISYWQIVCTECKDIEIVAGDGND